jgi:sarcosine oxidase subunit gamma
VTAEARTPLAGRREDLSRVAATTDRALVVEHVPFLAQVDVRLHPEAATRAPLPLPTRPNTAYEEGPRAALWLGPDEWLVLGPPGAGPEIVAEFDRALTGVHRSVVDVSANRLALELGGPRAKDVLAKGCGLDLDRRAWTTGSCAQTLLARVPVILQEREETTGVLIRPSYSNYLVDWLLEAAVEFDGAQRSG